MHEVCVDGCEICATASCGCANDGDCDDGLFCNGQEVCDPDSGSCLLGSLPCSPGATCDEDADQCLEFSERIIVAASLTPGTEKDIYMLRPDGGDLRNLSAEIPGNAEYPRIAPDGNHIAFYTDDGKLWVCQTSDASCDYVPGFDGGYLLDWYDDDTVMYLEHLSTCAKEVRVVDIDGNGDATLIPSPFLGEPEFANLRSRITPQGVILAGDWQAGCAAPTSDIYIVDAHAPGDPDAADGFLCHDSPGTDRQPVWNSDGTRLCWANDLGGSNWAIRCDCGEGNLIRPDGELICLDDFSPDDQHLLISRRVGQHELITLDIDTGEETTILSGSSIGYADWGVVNVSDGD
jgi:hypothetical protein